MGLMEDLLKCEISPLVKYNIQAKITTEIMPLWNIIDNCTRSFSLVII